MSKKVYTEEFKEQAVELAEKAEGFILWQSQAFSRSGVAKKRFQPQTTDSDHKLPIASRVFQTENKQTHPTKCNKVWTSDITFIPTDEGWLYLATKAPWSMKKLIKSHDNVSTF